jgi:hypothetical protein
MTFELTEEERHAVLLAIAELSLSRRGWAFMLREIAGKLHGEEMFEQFRKISSEEKRFAAPAN